MAGLVWFNLASVLSQSNIPIINKQWKVGSWIHSQSWSRNSSEQRIMYAHKASSLWRSAKWSLFHRRSSKPASSPGILFPWTAHWVTYTQRISLPQIEDNSQRHLKRDVSVNNTNSLMLAPRPQRNSGTWFLCTPLSAGVSYYPIGWWYHEQSWRLP